MSYTIKNNEIYTGTNNSVATGLKVLTDISGFTGIAYPKDIVYGKFINNSPTVVCRYSAQYFTNFNSPQFYSSFSGSGNNGAFAAPYNRIISTHRNVLCISVPSSSDIFAYKNNIAFSNTDAVWFPQQSYENLKNIFITNVQQNKLLLVPKFYIQEDSSSWKTTYIDSYISGVALVDFSYTLYYTDYENEKYYALTDIVPTDLFTNARLIKQWQSRATSGNIDFNELISKFTYPVIDFVPKNGYSLFNPITESSPITRGTKGNNFTTAINLYLRLQSGSDFTDAWGYYERFVPRLTGATATLMGRSSYGGGSQVTLPTTALDSFVHDFVKTMGLPYLTHLPTSFDDISNNSKIPTINPDGTVDPDGEIYSPATAPYFEKNLNDLVATGEELSETVGGEIDPPADDTNAIPTINLFNRTFAITAEEVKSLADELWNADETRFQEIINGLALLGANPIQGLIDLRAYPIDFTAWTGTTENIVVGRTKLNATGRRISTSTIPQFTADLGYISGNYPNDFRNYEPFSIFQIYLPFCGTRDIPANLIAGHTIIVKASVDIITGAISYIVKSDGYPILYANGTIGVSIPMTSDNATEYAGNVIHATNNVVQTGATVVQNIAHEATKGADVANAAKTGGVSLAAGAVSTAAAAVAGAASIATAGYELSTTINQTTIQQSGCASPSNSLYTSMNVYVLQETHAPVIPENYAHTVGRACRKGGAVSDFAGYTVFSNVDLSGVEATESEKTTILQTLQNGIYL